MGYGIFITATDTETGKTLCACGMARALKESGFDIGVYKPVLSGAIMQNGELIPADAAQLKEASGSNDDMSLINPYCFSTAVTPAHAASIERKAIDKRRLIKNYSIIKERHDLTLIEGAGGVMSPVTDTYLIIDLIRDLGCGAVIVTDTKLGRINHTLMTISALKSYGISVIGIIVNRYPRTPAESDSSLIKYLKIFSDVNILGIVEEVGQSESFYDDFINAFKKSVDLKVFEGTCYAK